MSFARLRSISLWESRSSYGMIIVKVLRILFYPIVIVLLFLSVVEFLPVAMGVYDHLKAYQWLIYGFAAYFIFRQLKVYARNEEWLQTLSHESSHAVVSMMFLHKIHSLNTTDDRGGVIFHSGRVGNLFISLAPYCLPVLTYVMMFLRLLGDAQMFYIFDIIIGFTLGFYVLCFIRQTRPYQTDIINVGYLRSTLFILTAWFFNATMILLTVRMGIYKAFLEVADLYWTRLTDTIALIF